MFKTNKKWLVLAALAVFAFVLAACATEPTVVTVEVPGEDGETVIVTQIVEVPAEGGGEEEMVDEGHPPYEYADEPYRVGIFSDVTTTNYWAANGPDNTVWNSYTLPTPPSAYSLAEVSFDFVPAVASDFPAPLAEEDGFWVTEVPFRDDVSWSDGEPVTAADWAFTAETVKKLGLISGGWGQWYDFGLLDHVEAVDDYTAKIYYHTKPGLARHEYGLLQSPILAEHYWAPAIEDAGVFANLDGVEAPGDDASEEAVGEYQALQAEAQDILFGIVPDGEPVAGAFAFSVWEPGAFLETSTNPDFYATGTTVTYYSDGTYQEAQGDAVFTAYGEGTGDVTLEYQVGPFVNSAVFSIYGTQDAALLALRDGEIDFVLNPLGLQRGLAEQVEGDPNLTVLENDTNGFRYLSFNVRRAPMSELAYRQAVATLIDKDFVTGTILQGVAFPLNSFVPEANAAWYYDDVPRWGYNEDGTPMSREDRVTEAVAILKDGGFSWDGTEPAWCPDDVAPCQNPGRLVNPDGTPVNDLELLAPSPGYDPLRSTFAVWIETWLQEAGIPVTANLTGFNIIVQKVFVEQDFDMQILGWSLTVFPDYLYDFFAEEQTVLDGNNAGGYVNQEFEDLAGNLLTCEAYEDCREIANNIQILLSTEVPYVVLFDTGIIEAYNSGNIEFPYNQTLSGLQFSGHAPKDSVVVR
jgi:ABC-type transport system substrate-binding protein